MNQITPMTGGYVSSTRRLANKIFQIRRGLRNSGRPPKLWWRRHRRL